MIYDSVKTALRFLALPGITLAMIVAGFIFKPDLEFALRILVFAVIPLAIVGACLFGLYILAKRYVRSSPAAKAAVAKVTTLVSPIFNFIPFRSIGVLSTLTVLTLVVAQLSGVSIPGQLYHRTHPVFADRYDVGEAQYLFEAIADGDVERVRSNLTIATQTQITLPYFLNFAGGSYSDYPSPTFAEYKGYWARARDHWYRATHIENRNRDRAHWHALNSDNPEILAVFAPYLWRDYFDNQGLYAQELRRHYGYLMERAVAQEDYFSAYQATVALVSLIDPNSINTNTFYRKQLADLFFLTGFFAEMSGQTNLTSGQAEDWLALFVDFIDNTNEDYASDPSPYEAAGRALLARIEARGDR